MALIHKLRHAMNVILFWVNALLITLLVIDVSWQVLSRYVAASPSTFTDEAARYLMVWMAFLGGAYLFGSNSHLSVTTLRDKFKGRFKEGIALGTYLLIIAFAFFVMIYGSQRLILRTIGQPSASLGIPMGLVYSILPLSAICIIYYMILHIAEMFITRSNDKRN